MKILLSKYKLTRLIKNEKKLGFVPTMGSIHDGHISLIKKSIKMCDKTIVSIYINKPQFNNKDDFLRYPKNFKNDINIIKKLKIDYLFIPNTKQIYPSGYNKKIKINNFSKELCGRFRAGHFNAVVDVIDRMVKIIMPHRIFLGEKDFQQLKLIEDFLLKKYKKNMVVLCKTVREKNGIAYSSRNVLLTKKEKDIASGVYKFIKKNKKKILNKRINTKNIKNKINNLGVKKIEYLKAIDINNIFKQNNMKKKYKIFFAYYLRNIRLIDNI
ncbi:MAG: pantoate--beta-alanine ligase [Pelagibacterales bacterium]|nr:pantoate--beta-alanine ligase [Pelagibacterales bacterium]